MYTRSNSMILSVQTRQESFVYPRAVAARSTAPEIFTFERIPSPSQTTAVRSYAPLRPKKRCTRVMYPAKVHMHLPPAEKSAAKRWLVALCLVVLWQIYTEEPCMDTPLGSTESPASDFQVLPFQSAEEQVRQLTDIHGLQVAASESTLVGHESASWYRLLSNGTSSPDNSLDETEVSSVYDQSTRNGYMVALLVYHKLGSDN